MIEAQ